jgi:hypothetical protein
MNRIRRADTIALWASFALLAACQLHAKESTESTEGRPAEITWHTNYGEAMTVAKLQEKMLLIYFSGDQSTANGSQFEAALRDEKISEHIEDYVFTRLPLDATITVEGKPVRLLEHGAFAELSGKSGVAIIDMVHRDADYYGHVVTTLPLVPGRYYHFRPEHVRVALELPAGTHTQRTMVFAVRIHPEAPSSTKGEIDSMLLDEACNHCDHQAQIRVQGHHNWGSRFQRITGRLPHGLHAQEIVAESWPHQTIMDAAVDCVHSWRQSSGHWSAVRSQQPRFGYDMRRGTNGIWYATGLFGNRH